MNNNATLLEELKARILTPELFALLYALLGLGLIFYDQKIPFIPERVVEAIGTAFLVGSVASIMDKLLFSSAVQKSFIGTISPLIQQVDEISGSQKVLADRYESTMLSGIDKIFLEGTPTFAGDLLDGVGGHDHLIILESFLDQVTLIHNGGKLYERVRERLNRCPEIHISLIGLAYTEETKAQIISRALMSKEMGDHLKFLREYWEFVAELIADFPGRVSAREIQFLPSIAAFAIERGAAHNGARHDSISIQKFIELNPTDIIQRSVSELYIINNCDEIYYAPIMSSSSQLVPYYYKRYAGQNRADSYTDYINMSWLMGTEFTEEIWIARMRAERELPLFSDDLRRRLNRWRGAVSNAYASGRIQ